MESAQVIAVRPENDTSMAATVLVIDDYSTHRVLLHSVITQMGCRVVDAADGRSGLEAVREHRPALVILDLILPDIDGIEVLRRLRADSTLASTPVLIVTAVEEDERAVEALEAGADDYVTKPFNPVVLQARIKVLLRAARLQRELTREAALQAASAEMAGAAASVSDVTELCARVAAALHHDRADLRAALFVVDGEALLGPFGWPGVEPETRPLNTAVESGLGPVLCGEMAWLRRPPQDLAALGLTGAGAELVVCPVRHGDKVVALAVFGQADRALRETDVRLLADRCGPAGLAVSAALDRLAREATESRYHALIEQAADGIAILDPVTHECHEVNHTLATWVSAFPGVLTGRPFSDLFDRHSRPLIEDALRAAADGRRQTVAELKLADGAGHLVPVEVALRRIGHAGGTDLLAVLHDLRPRQAVGQYEQTAGNLDNLSRTVRALNHEISNPLTCIIGVTQLLQIRMRDLPDHVGQLDKILASAEQIKELCALLREVAIKLGGEQPLGDVDALIDKLVRTAAR